MELLTQSKGTLFSFMHSHPVCEPSSLLSSPNSLTFCRGTGSGAILAKCRQILWKWWAFCAQLGQIIPTFKPHWVQVSPSCQNVYHPQLARVTSLWSADHYPKQSALQGQILNIILFLQIYLQEACLHITVPPHHPYPPTQIPFTRCQSCFKFKTSFPRSLLFAVFIKQTPHHKHPSFKTRFPDFMGGVFYITFLHITFYAKMWKWTNNTACICHELVDEIVIKIKGTPGRKWCYCLTPLPKTKQKVQQVTFSRSKAQHNVNPRI